MICIPCLACSVRCPAIRSFRVVHQDSSQTRRYCSHFQPTVAQFEQAESNTNFYSHKPDSESILFWERDLDGGSVSEGKADIQICRPRLHVAVFALVHCAEDLANTSQDTPYSNARCTESYIINWIYSMKHDLLYQSGQMPRRWICKHRRQSFCCYLQAAMPAGGKRCGRAQKLSQTLCLQLDFWPGLNKVHKGPIICVGRQPFGIYLAAKATIFISKPWAKRLQETFGIRT